MRVLPTGSVSERRNSKKTQKSGAQPLFQVLTGVFIRSDVHTLNDPGVYQQDKSGWFNDDTEKLTLFGRISYIPPINGSKVSGDISMAPHADIKLICKPPIDQIFCLTNGALFIRAAFFTMLVQISYKKLLHVIRERRARRYALAGNRVLKAHPVCMQRRPCYKPACLAVKPVSHHRAAYRSHVQP